MTNLRQRGADIITVHAEACKHLDRTIEVIKEHDILAGVALNPATPLEAVEYIPAESGYGIADDSQSGIWRTVLHFLLYGKSP